MCCFGIPLRRSSSFAAGEGHPAAKSRLDQAKGSLEAAAAGRPLQMRPAEPQECVETLAVCG